VPRVSVVIPAYNGEAYLEACLASVCAQTAPPLEVLVIDDGSTDRTAAIAQAFAARDGRVRCIRQENTGVSAARNRGVAEAAGDWIAFLDGDDLWLPEKLERQLALQEATGADLLYTAAACIDENGEPTGRTLTSAASVTFETLLRGNKIVSSSVLVRRTWLERFPMEHDELHEDYLCWLRLLQNGCKAAGIPEPLVQYRVSAGSKSGNKLHSAQMTWETLRAAGVPFCKRCACFAAYAVHGLRRYL